MTVYKAPLRDFRFLMNELWNAPEVYRGLPFYAENETADPELMTQVLEEAARFCEQVLLPLNPVGDQEGCTRDADGNVRTPTGFKEAYRKFREAGWTALDADPAHGGQGMPHLVAMAVMEMLNSTNLAWAMYPGLSHGAYSALHRHGSDDLKSVYLEKLVSGEWTGTMCLTEPHAGTDVGLTRTRAVEGGDGSYSITGNKIFISAGEHDMADNILHLVLARVDGSPEGTKGISLFLVPKFEVNSDGSLGERNGVVCGSLEHKMGIHGNATAVLNFDGAKGYLVGEVNRGMMHMFTMMNAARLGVGIQGLGLGETAYQSALKYAQERLQMRAEPRATGEVADPIVYHGDVRRMLLTMRAYNEGGRALSLWLAQQLDVEEHHPDEAARKDAADIVALLTPVAKAFLTDNAYVSTTLGQQVFGGHGYVREWGMEQLVRDCRITQIYEGTNGIQALDLLGRKVLMDGGKKLQKLAGILQEFVEAHEEHEVVGEYARTLGKAAGQIGTLTMLVGQKAMEGEQGQNEVNAVAVDYLRYLGHVTLGYMWARMAAVAADKVEAGDDADGFYAAKLGVARFYFEKLFPETKMLSATLKAGYGSMNDDRLFGLE